MTEFTAKLASSSTVEMTQLVMPSDANGLGTAFGGRVMQWIDLAASMAGMRHCRTPVVTASIDQLAFLAPIRVGDIVVLKAQVNAVFGTSMEIQVDVLAEKPATGERQPCCEAFLTFVSLGPSGRPARAPILLPQTEEQERRARDAAARREARLARRGARCGQRLLSPKGTSSCIDTSARSPSCSSSSPARPPRRPLPPREEPRSPSCRGSIPASSTPR